jgi:hypothetical protein
VLRSLHRSGMSSSRPARSTGAGPVLAAALLEQLADGVIACNADGSTLTFNRTHHGAARIVSVSRMRWVSTFLSKAVMAGFMLGRSIGIVIAAESEA